MVDMARNAPGVKGQDLADYVLTGYRQRFNEKTYSICMPPFHIFFYNVLDHFLVPPYFWISGISKATHLPGPMPKDAQEPFNSNFLVLPIP